MEIILINSIILILLLALSIFFSGTETALFSLKKSDLHRFSISPSNRDKRIAKEMETPDRILATILLGNLLVNIFVTAMTTSLILYFFKNYGHIISILVVTPVIIVLCEITPKIIAMNTSISFARKSFPLLQFFNKLLLPLRNLILLFSGFFVKIFKLDLSQAPITEDELGHVVKSGEMGGVLDKKESKIIKNVIMFSKREAENIMYPRNQAFFIQKDATVQEAMDLVLGNDIVRIPVFDQDLDSICGIVDARDLLPAYLGLKKIKKISKYIKPIEFFPSSKDLDELLSDFLEKKIQIAILVDEYGGTAGVVTLNSILAAILGKEFGNWDNIPTMIVKISDNNFIVNGETQLDEFNSYFETNLVSKHSETFGGYIIESLNHLPETGEVVEIEKMTITVKKLKKNKIETLKVHRA